MYSLRKWSTRHARAMDLTYRVTANLFHVFDPLWKRMIASRLEKPFTACESWAKGVLFDCQMCGQCVLSVTGMTCPTNCPKSLRNGPCGGVRANGHCEVKPELRCVWVEAWSGARSMKKTALFQIPLPAREYDLEGRSAWLGLAAANIAGRDADNTNDVPS
ncbi:MAG: hypothetical protein HN725_06515 [Alphaproteobacteria bacterium]|jgi:hypothetical protein|nr:hypothetical protein [Alphaproteobacteria bacterium]MBT4084701.1 hypothetical protein [Alphaproteobacteria bacterium]MBT4544657.1 hypothetical protein [Alphaproteobacteria bacterium]MBT7744929.1 hypothetical protein [Alphaproteobacteria bacterium]